ncbi:peptide/nickel transport system substrate-binding protein [Acetitomaculum ruminis DSM 5522]|uniref:Peptide/nickel transport system substrate-binding protein n=1 Tax=Acetitomaculum ruminis DSM 5522 TaxID=1120918 RepID=A0A1I0ZP74_9FIRM|nr:ABC transporter substrate-binding protein [Acetitomaculum ruminis]SFB26260.1 peptide/nickel transport system substrate-binding protein [Acetitomaculum ruminis DSM 5522]
MKNLKVKKVLAVLMAVAMCTGLAACGENSKEDKTSAVTKENESSDTTQKSDDSDMSNTLVYAGENEDSINPVLTNHDELTDIIFSGLMKFDGSGKPVADLAEDYEFDEENLTYKFTLRKGVKWHDGEDFTADDVEFTYKTLTEDDTLSSSVTTDYEDIETITIVDENTVEFKLKNYNANMLGYFTIGIIPKHLLEGKDIATDEFNQNPVGTGRYKFVEWDTTGGMLTLEKNEDYYGKVPNIDRLVYKTVAVESTKATMIQSGEADLAWLNANYAAKFEGNDDYNTWDFKTADYRGASMDMKSDFWKANSDSIGVLNYALDKDAIIKSVLNSQGCAAYSPIQLNPLGTDKEADIYSYDLDKFDEEMKKLGWEKNSDGIYERNGQKFHFTIQTRDYEEERVDIANLMSSMLEKAGVEMEVKLVTKFDWEAGYDGFLAGFATQFDPDMAYKQFVTDGSSNTMSYSNAKVDEYLEAGRRGKTEEERKEAYANFEKEYAKTPGVLLVAYLDGNYVGSKGVEGLDTTRVLGHHAVGVMWNIEEWTITR